MSESTRRGFLGIAGAGAVAAGTAVVAPAAAADPDTKAPAGSAKDRVVAYVSDARKGEVSIMSGEREVVVKDRALANRILNAARR